MKTFHKHDVTECLTTMSTKIENMRSHIPFYERVYGADLPKLCRRTGDSKETHNENNNQ